MHRMAVGMTVAKSVHLAVQTIVVKRVGLIAGTTVAKNADSVSDVALDPDLIAANLLEDVGRRNTLVGVQNEVAPCPLRSSDTLGLSALTSSRFSQN